MSTYTLPLTSGMSETTARTTAFEVGCLTLVAESPGSAGPGGTTHFVDGWEPVCGSERVRFVFPGRSDQLSANCPDCVQAVRVPVGVPRQRTASKPAASRTASRAAGTTRTRRAS